MDEQYNNQSKVNQIPNQPTLLTAEDLLKKSDDSFRYELVKGIIRKMPPAGFEHGVRAVKIVRYLDVHTEKHKLGYVCGAETGFKISQDPDTVLAPDAAFVSQNSIDEQGIPKGYWVGAPDLAVEIISPNDTYTEVAEKADQWLSAGCKMVWVINPRRETVEVYRSNEDITVLRGDDILEGKEVIEGFQCRVEDLFV
jgi:Uma2 family endonuclease